MRYLVPLGRLCYAAIFLLSGPRHFTAAYVGYAAQQGVPAPGVLVPLAGVLALLGGLSIVLGYRAKAGAWLLVVFLVPVTLMMHRFWTITDPMMAGVQMAHFLKNVALLGTALVFTQLGAGPVSLDERGAAPQA
jgi:putative oxidoreductase